MNFRFNKEIKTLFVDIDTPNLRVKQDDVVDVILSPSYYWVKKVNLPVKYLRDVKKLLPSLFDDIILEDDDSYNYSAYKDGDSYLIFAYQDSKILDSLSKKGIKSSQINRVFFAQSEFSNISTAISIDEHSVLAVKDSIVIKIPSIMVQDSQDLYLNRHQLSKNNISIEKYSHIIDTKTQISIISLVAVFIIIFSVELFISSSKVASIQSREESLFQDNKLLATSFQNEAVLKRLERTFHEQNRVREILSIIFSHKVGKDEYLQNVEIKNKKVYATFKLTSSANIKSTHEKLKNAKVKTISNYNNNLLKLEMQL